MATLQEEARALGDPTRHSVFRYLANKGRPVDVAELTNHVGLNHNAVRQHLAKLVDANLVVEGRADARGPGRPRLLYTVDPGAESRWGVTGPYERLSLLLSEVIRSGDTPREVGRRAGQAQSSSGGDAESAIRSLHDVMAREGFDPEIRRRRDGVEVVLRACPFETTAIADPGTVCQLHLGLAEGLASGADTVEVDDLIAKDPRRGNCRLRLRVDNPPTP
jgi:predicted ArsR family transcriptional regulator